MKIGILGSGDVGRRLDTDHLDLDLDHGEH
jgi:hypothetical protein